MKLRTIIVWLFCGLGLACLAAPAARAAPPMDDALTWMYQPDEIVRINLQLSPDQIAALEVDPKTWAPDVSFEMEASGDRQYGPWEIKARLKGSASFRPLSGKAAFLLKFPKGSRPDGLKRITLNNMVQDPTFMHETLSYEVFRAAEVPAARTGYAQVWVNGDYYGLYLNVEKYNDQAMDRWFSSTQHLYEAPGGRDFLSSSSALFEADEGDEDDFSDLEAVAAAMDTGDWTEIEEHFAVPERAIRFLAAEWYLGQLDGYAVNRNNYYLHSDEDGRFTILPSGTDQTFTTHPNVEHSLSLPFSEAVANWHFLDLQNSGTLMEACVANSECAARFTGELLDLRQLVADLAIRQKVEALSSELNPLIQEDPRRESTMLEVEALQKQVPQFLDGRDAQINEFVPDTVIDSGPAGLITTDQVAFTFSGSPVGDTAKVMCKVDSGAFENCESPKTLTGLTEGPHTVAFRAEDIAGNQDLTPATRTFTVDSGSSPACVVAEAELTVADTGLNAANRKVNGAKKRLKKAKVTLRKAKSARAFKVRAARKKIRKARGRARVARKNRKTRIRVRVARKRIRAVRGRARVARKRIKRARAQVKKTNTTVKKAKRAVTSAESGVAAACTPD